VDNILCILEDKLIIHPKLNHFKDNTINNKEGQYHNLRDLDSLSHRLESINHNNNISNKHKACNKFQKISTFIKLNKHHSSNNLNSIKKLHQYNQSNKVSLEIIKDYYTINSFENDHLILSL